MKMRIGIVSFFVFIAGCSTYGTPGTPQQTVCCFNGLPAYGPPIPGYVYPTAGPGQGGIIASAEHKPVLYGRDPSNPNNYKITLQILAGWGGINGDQYPTPLHSGVGTPTLEAWYKKLNMIGGQFLGQWDKVPYPGRWLDQATMYFDNVRGSTGAPPDHANAYAGGLLGMGVVWVDVTVTPGAMPDPKNSNDKVLPL
jgi:hypothetical protein